MTKRSKQGVVVPAPSFLGSGIAVSTGNFYLTYAKNLSYLAMETTKNDLQLIEDFADRITDELLNGDFIPPTVYDKLPNLLKTSSDVFNEPRERDVFLWGVLGALGGCFHNLIAYNEVDKKGLHTNLIVFVVAPPASGKRALDYARKLIQAVKEDFKGKDKKILLVPANNSASGLIQLLEHNEGVGVMIESEIDTLLNAQKQDWGQNNDIIRNSFENEPYSMYRKKDREHVEIGKPRLSIAISGTESQFKQLIVSPDNGLFSRGCYYVFSDIDPVLKSFGRLTTSVDVAEQFVSFAKIVSGYYGLLTSHDSLRINFSALQMSFVQAVFQEAYSVVIDGDELLNLQANVKRSFSIALKISAIMEALFRCENGSLTESSECSERALELGTLLALTSLVHAEWAVKILAAKQRPAIRSNNHKKLYNNLPDVFSKDELIALAVKLGMAQKTGYNAFKYFSDNGHIEMLPDGQYQKLK